MINIYVANLASTTTEQNLKSLFEGYGEVTSVRIINDRLTGQPRGFAFVEMSNKAEGAAAISGLNGQDLNGKALSVTEARPKTDRPNNDRGGFGGNRGGGSRY